VTHSITAKAQEYGLDIDPARPVHTLSVGEMQRVEIIRALLTNPKLLILDEPTSVLTPQAVEKLFVVLKKLASEGCSILYISHKLHEIRELCTACTVLRGGKVTGVCNPGQESNASLSRLMIGAEPPAADRTAAQTGRRCSRCEIADLPREDQFGVDLTASPAGARGRGGGHCRCVGQRPERAAVRAVGRRHARRPAIRAHGWGGRCRRPRAAPRRKLGLHFVPEERLGRGAVPTLGLAHNLLLTRNEALSKPGRLDAGQGTCWRRRRQDIIRASTSRPAGRTAAAQVAVRAATCRSSSSGARSTPTPSC
jgi:ABC-type uncharacterized transport system ATPase subunit